MDTSSWVNEWFERRTFDGANWSAEAVAALKRHQQVRVSVVLPALNEAATVGTIVGAIAGLARRHELVDEIVVMDSGSTDATAEVASAAGARVVHVDDVVAEYRGVRGKGDALWKSLFVTSGDVVVFIDADLRNFTPQFVVGLLGPLLSDPAIGYVKAVYDRALTTEREVSPHGGGRVTELMARPLINAYWPDLAGFVQPLSGEYAGRRELLERVPFVAGYGVELGLLVDLWGLAGADALAQVDLGQRVHRNKSDDALGRMASEVFSTAMRRVPHALAPPSEVLIQYEREGLEGYTMVPWQVPTSERPPAITLAGATAAAAR